MKKQKKESASIPFKTKLFLGAGAIFFALAIAACLLFSAFSFENTTKSDQLSSTSILERVSIQVDSLYEQMNIAATSITKNPSLKAVVLDLNMSPEDISSHYTSQLETSRVIQTSLGNMMFSSIISNVLLFNPDQNYFYYTGSYYQDMDYVYDHLQVDNTLPLLNNQSVVYRAPHQSPWTTDEKIVLSVSRNFSDMATTANTIVEIQVPYGHLLEICEQSSYQGEKEIVLLDSSGTVIYPYKHQDNIVSADTLNKIRQQILDGSKSFFSYEYSYYANKSTTTEFTTVLISNNRTIHAQTISFILATVIVVLAILSAALGLLYIIFNRFTQPLQQLIGHVNELSLDHDTKLRLPPDSIDEFALLNNSLNQMVTNLKASIQENYELQVRETNANLAALQAQIDPHFLYNALNSISAASEIYDSEITTKMCQELSSMMRYVTSTQTSVSLIEEITHIRNYLEFMKVSNGSNFNYLLTIPEKLYHLKIPKLSIQPFAENSFRHGFKNTLPPWFLSITCSECDNFWTIVIEDNGEGFSEDALLHITEEPISATSLEINGLGLNNTLSRLSLFFGGHFTYHIENISQGCSISLKGAYTND